MFAPRGYTAVPQDVASQDEDEVVENNNLSKSFEHHSKWSGERNMDAMSTPHTSRESEEVETKERRVKRNVRFESRSIEVDKPEPMSNARRLCFVVSLMICTLTIFVFAFTVPCKGPSCNVANMITTVTSNLEKFHRNWSMDFSGYSTGIVFHLSSTKTREIVVSYNGKRLREKDLTRSHRYEKFGGKWNGKSPVQNKWNTKKSGLISLNEDNGKLQWIYNASDVLKLIECRTDDNGFETCLIESSHGKLQLIDPRRNQIVWSTRILIGSLLPSIIIGISDCDGDDGRDILLSYDRFNTTCIPPTNKTVCTHPGIVQLISGRTGYPLGSRLNIPQSHLIKRVSVHSTRQTENLIFVLTVGNKGHLKVISIQDLYSKILDVRGGESRYLFKNSTVSVSAIVSTDHQPVVKDLNKDFVEDIILVTLSGNKHSLTAVDGGKLKKMWRIAFGSKKMLSQPVIGHFNDDEVPDILVVLQDPMLSLLNQSLVQILDGQNGNIMWTKKLRLAKNTTPLSASVGYKSDVFLLWVEEESKRKYQKIFPTKRVKDVEEQQTRMVQEIKRKPKAKQALNKASFDARDDARKSNNSAQQQMSEHRRSPRNVESRKQMVSSGVEAELDSLVDEIFVKDFKPTSTTPSHEKRRKPHIELKRTENTHKILEDILKQEEEPLTMTGKESHSHGGTPKTITKTRLSTQQPEFYDSPRRMGVIVKHLKLNSHSSESKSRKPSPTTLNLATHAMPKKPSLAHSGNRATNEKHTIHTSTKPTVKLSHRKRVEDGSESNIENHNKKDSKQRRTQTTILPTQLSLEKNHEIHEVTQEPSTAKTGKPTIDSAHSHGNEQRQTLTSTSRTQIKNVRHFEAGKAGRDADIKDKNNDDRQQISTVTFTTTKHISSLVTLPTIHAKDEDNRKTDYENIDDDNTKPSEKIIVSDIDSVPGRVLAPQLSFTLPPAKPTKTTISNTVHAHREHHIPISVEEMTEDKLRGNKDIIVMPTKPSATKVPTSEYLQKSTQEKRQIDYRTTQTTTQQRRDTNTKKRLALNQATQTKRNNSAPNDGSNRQLDLDNTNTITDVITTTSPSQDVHKNNRGVSNIKPSPKSLREINHTEISVKKPTKKSNALSSLGKNSLRMKHKIRNSVLSNSGNKKVTVDDGSDTKNSRISHPVKLNGTDHLDENKVIKEKKQKSNQSEPHQSQLQQASVNTTKSHSSKLGNVEHPTTRSHETSSKKNHKCHKGSDLALIAIFPDSKKNTFTVISQESNIRNTKKGLSMSSSCDTLWPTLNSNPLVHDADSDGFLEIIYAVNYGEDTEIDRTMKVRKFSIKVDSDD